jgi:alpha-D-xyloside xylohydrolase
MAETLRSGLSISHSGFGFWSHDIAGFEQTATADVYKRWAAFGLLSSHSRLHGSSSYRVPWLFDDEASEVVKKFARLKNRLMPYIYSAAVEAHTEGIPVLRSMMFEFPESIACETCDTQYMLGANLLVAPVMHKDGHVDYYLPAGEWTSLLTDEVVTGDTWRRETHDHLSLPLMVRPNSVIPMGSDEERPDYDYADGLELHVFEPEDGEITVAVPDLRGNVAATYVVCTKDGRTTVETDSAKTYTVVVHR